jgi:hypothetical protein
VAGVHACASAGRSIMNEVFVAVEAVGGCRTGCAVGDLRSARAACGLAAHCG